MVLIFDLDDTLYDEMTYVKSGFMAVSKYGERNYGWNSNQSYNFMLSHLKEYGRGKIFDTWLASNGALTKKRVSDCVRTYRHHDPKIKLTAVAEKILKEYEHTLPMYLVTDGHKVVQQKKIEALRVKRFFKRTFITHRYGIHNAKPSLYCFDLARRLERAEWKDLVYVGDNPLKDFVNLNVVGSLTIRVQTGSYADTIVSSDYDGQITIPTLLSIPELLNQFIR